MSKLQHYSHDSAGPARKAEVLETHRRAGRHFEAAGVRSFVREQGSGPTVLCIHGMIGSSFLYRKVLAELAAVDELGLDQFHLVVHDIGGPVGFELAAAVPGRVLSLTMLNTTVDVTDFKSPWTMEPFRHRGLGELWMKSLNPPAFRFLMRLQGIGDPATVSKAELNTYLALVKGPDHGRAFLQIMRSSERTPGKQARYRAAVGNVPYPVQAIWAADDPTMTLASYGEKARVAAGLSQVHTIPGKHFPQEDQAPAIAQKIAEFAFQHSQVRHPEASPATSRAHQAGEHPRP